MLATSRGHAEPRGAQPVDVDLHRREVEHLPIDAESTTPGIFSISRRMRCAGAYALAEVGILNLDVDRRGKPKFSTWVTMSAFWK